VSNKLIPNKKREEQDGFPPTNLGITFIYQEKNHPHTRGEGGYLYLPARIT
jgi:hypothetical protein